MGDELLSKKINSHRSMLVVDVDLQFLDTLKNDPRSRNIPVHVAYNGKDAQLIISDRTKALAGIFVSPSLRYEPNWLSVIKCAYIHRPATPLYLIAQNREEAKELKDDDFKKLGIRDFLVKPKSTKELMELVAPIAISFDAEEALRKSKNTDTTKVGDEVIDGNNQSYIPIRADDFLSGSKSFFDVYVKLGSNRFIKLLQSGDIFEPERIDNYLRKGVLYFYIKKEVQEVYVSYCDHLATALLKSDKVSIDVKSSQTLNQGEETMKHFKLMGVSDANIKYADKFIANVKDLTKQVIKAAGNDKNNLMSKFISTAALYEHGVGTSMLAGVLANTMQISTDNPLQIIGMSSLMHDIGLVKVPEELWHEDESKMSHEQILLYQTHPIIGADILTKLHTMNPAAVQAVEQHHMRLFGAGFPKRAGTTIVNKVAEIVGICSEYQHILEKNQKNPNVNIQYELEFKVFPYFSKAIVKQFKMTFLPNIKFKEDSVKVVEA